MVPAYSPRPVDCGVLAMNNNEQTPLAGQQHRPYSISVVMIVKDEVENLQISLPAVADWVDEIIVLDSGSNDESKSVAEKYGAKWFVNTDWQGFGKQKQLAQSYARGDWILALDADEAVSPELKESILSVSKDKPGDKVYGFRRIDYIGRYCIDNPKWILPLKTYWRLYPNHFTYNDNNVHESLDISRASKTLSLQGYLNHHTAFDYSHWLNKRVKYAIIWAEEKHSHHKKTNIFSIIGHSFWAFVKTFIIEGRFLLGGKGFLYSSLFAQYTFNKYVVLYDLNRRGQKE
ncbi:MAG: hypothetical protein CR975_04175 [Gammaproteobacteria bacterium]|nr:MAG: hypothetical protein CR975_04175 [Gammaproteobacteria bacterium]